MTRIRSIIVLLSKCLFIIVVNSEDECLKCFANVNDVCVRSLSSKNVFSTNPVANPVSCDKTNEKFDTLRKIRLDVNGSFVLSWKCRQSGDCSSTRIDKISQCLSDRQRWNKVRQNLFDFYLNRGFCRCTNDGMERSERESCKIVDQSVRRLCSREEMVGVNQTLLAASFVCSVEGSNSGDTLFGCKFKHPKAYDNYFLDILNVAGDIKNRQMLCYGDRYNARGSISSMFGCPDEFDALFGTVDDFATTESPDTVTTAEPSSLIGPIFAVVVIFLTVVVAGVFIVNAVRVWQVHKKWSSWDKDEKLKEKQRNELKSEEKGKLALNRKPACEVWATGRRKDRC